MVAQEPGPMQAGQGRKPATPVVHSASLDGPAAVRQRRAKRSWPCACRSLSRNTQGAHSFDCSMSCANRHAVMLSRTLRHVSDLAMLFCRPTVPHAAAFILPSLGRRFGPRRSCAIPRQIANGQKQTKHSDRGFCAGSLQSICRIFGGRTCITCCQIEQSQDAGAAAAVPVVCRSGAGRRQSRRVSVGRGNVRCCG